MLVLAMKEGELVRLIDQTTNIEIGVVKCIQPRRSTFPDEQILVGFDFDDEVQIVRDTLVSGKKASEK